MNLFFLCFHFVLIFFHSKSSFVQHTIQLLESNLLEKTFLKKVKNKWKAKICTECNPENSIIIFLTNTQNLKVAKAK